ncbi:MAG: hypothetical protein HZB92_05265 [Euryarchaeota archaeon]|nr:hypothetical protein [Euryarchaeota archaeon]
MATLFFVGMLDLSPWLTLSLSQFQLYALVFLLGSFAVASLSDLRRMSAQREFLEIWLLAALVVVAYDVYIALTGGAWLVPLVKWVIVAVLAACSHRSVGALFSLAIGDVCAIVAVAGLLSPVLVIVFFVALKISDLGMRPFLRLKGGGGAYPFMPVVLIGTLVMIALVVWAFPFLLGLWN